MANLGPQIESLMGYRQVGKALDFDSSMRRFKSCYPIHFSSQKFGRKLPILFVVWNIGRTLMCPPVDGVAGLEPLGERHGTPSTSNLLISLNFITFEPVYQIPVDL